MSILLQALIVGYLLGSIPFGLVLARLAGYGDIRKIGSGNIGATNVLRTGNKGLALLTLLLDSGKGALAVAIMTYFYTIFRFYIGEMSPSAQENLISLEIIASLTGFAAILGHCFPVWLKFKGGKGVATTLGMLLAALPWAGFVACCTWGIVAGFFRDSSLSALCAVAIAPLAALLIYGPVPAVITALTAALVWFRHKDNIRRLLAGTEPKIGEKKKSLNHKEHEGHEDA